jgi:predicted Kef-type K+ transport protein
VVKLLDQKGDLDSLYGRIAVGIFLVQDLVVVVALTFLSGLGSGEALTAGSVTRGIAEAFGGMALLLGGACWRRVMCCPAPSAGCPCRSRRCSS